MNAINARGVAFAIKTAMAATAAILIALSFNLPNPGWAGLTVFLTSQQLGAASGAVISRSLYRMLGTLLAIAGILFLLPALGGAPELLILGVAAWVGLCLYLSLLDRGPRAYVFLLAAYTLPLIGLPLVNSPSSIFDATMWRAQEIGLGAVVSMAVHTVFAPRSIRPQVVGKLKSIVSDARHWIAQGLASDGAVDDHRPARERLGADLAEARTLAAVLRFDPGIEPRDVATVTALEERLLALLPLLSGVEDRLAAIRAIDADLGARVDAHVEAVGRHMEQAPDGADAARLRTAGSTLAVMQPHQIGKGEVLSIGAMQRLAELTEAWDQCLALLRQLDEPASVPDDATRQLVARASARMLHVDPGIAALSGFAAALAVVVAGTLCWMVGWDQGGATVGIAAVGSSLFAFLDDPRGLQKTMLFATMLAAPVAALYVFAIFPALDGYVALALALAPFFFVSALFLSMPKWSVPALGFVLVAVTLLSVQPAQGGDFSSFTTVAVGAVLGVVIALVVTSLVRVIGVETSVRRLMHAAWRDLAAMADGTRRPSRATWGSRMMDRIGLLLPRMAGTSGVMRAQATRALDDLRMGANLLELRDAARTARPEVRSAIESVLTQIAAHFRQRLVRPDIDPAPALQQSIDGVIAGLIASDAGTAQRLQGLTAATGVLLGLFPQPRIAATRNGDTP